MDLQILEQLKAAWEMEENSYKKSCNLAILCYNTLCTF